MRVILDRECFGISLSGLEDFLGFVQFLFLFSFNKESFEIYFLYSQFLAWHTKTKYVFPKYMEKKYYLKAYYYHKINIRKRK